jgi:hypothetical protein
LYPHNLSFHFYLYHPANFILFYSYYFLLSFIWYLFFPTHLCSFLLHFLFSSYLPCLLQLFVSAAISCCFTHHNRPIPPFSISKSPLSMLNLCCYPKDRQTVHICQITLTIITQKTLIFTVPVARTSNLQTSI